MYDIDWFAEFYLMVEGDQCYWHIREAYSRYVWRIETESDRRNW